MVRRAVAAARRSCSLKIDFERCGTAHERLISSQSRARGRGAGPIPERREPIHGGSGFDVPVEHGPERDPPLSPRHARRRRAVHERRTRRAVARASAVACAINACDELCDREMRVHPCERSRDASRWRLTARDSGESLRVRVRGTDETGTAMGAEPPWVRVPFRTVGGQDVRRGALYVDTRVRQIA